MKSIYTKNRTKKLYKKNGGKVRSSPVLEKILSVGFEFESGNMIPVLYDIDGRYIVTEQTPDKLPSIAITNDIDVHITSDADTPRVTGGVHSSMSEMEQTYLNPDNQQFRNFIDEHVNVIDSTGGYNFYNHTEYMFTFLKDNHAFIDKDIIMKYFKFVIDYLMVSFIEDEVIENEEVDTKLKIFNNGSLQYLIPMKFGQDLTPIDIKWVPQMTINVKVIDIMSVLEYLIVGANADSVNNIINCKVFAYKIIPHRIIPDIDKPEFTEVQKHILNILRNCVFMLLYLFIYGSSLEGTVFQNIDKNHFDFLFRCSISRIIISVCTKYDKSDILPCLNYLKNRLIHEQTYILGNIQYMRTQQVKININEFYKYNACISFIIFIDYLISKNNLILQKYVSMLSTATHEESDDIFNEIYSELKLQNIRPLTQEEKDKVANDPRKPISKYYLSKNTFFTEIFQGSSNYYRYDNDNESILIEYRSFGQNLLIEAKDATKNVYKNLKEWQNIITTIGREHKTIKPIKSMARPIIKSTVRKSSAPAKPKSTTVRKSSAPAKPKSTTVRKSSAPSTTRSMRKPAMNPIYR